MPLRLPAAAAAAIAATLPGATIRPARGSLHHPLSPLHMTTTTATTSRARPSPSFSTSHPSSKDATVLMDQTRKDNRPGGAFKQGEGEEKAEHEEHEHEGAHPAKRHDPQATPSKSAGVRTDGPGGRAGEGAHLGGAVQKDVDAVEGAKQHSVKRPVPTGGNTAAGRGGDAL
ncbi:hypothetical protein SLS53_002614 [Cytospora paraplurivora]|uniref:Uncharacterized protein n=1 Tax=Cytospora paraplurivora TaxID=2898453 RepID=A0AAN9YKN8_9PEZI